MPLATAALLLALPSVVNSVDGTKSSVRGGDGGRESSRELWERGAGFGVSCRDRPNPCRWRPGGYFPSSISPMHFVQCGAHGECHDGWDQMCMGGGSELGANVWCPSINGCQHACLCYEYRHDGWMCPRKKHHRHRKAHHHHHHKKKKDCTEYFAEVNVTAPEFVYFNGGADFPPGEYLIKYENGCWKADSEDVDWVLKTLSGFSSFDYGPYLVGDDSDPSVTNNNTWLGCLPGLVNGSFSGFSDFDECVVANQMVSPVTYTHAGGKLGVFHWECVGCPEFEDRFYTNNVEGTPSPTYSIIPLKCAGDVSGLEPISQVSAGQITSEPAETEARIDPNQQEN